MTRSTVTIAVLAACTLGALASTAVVQTSQSSPGGLLISAAELAALKDSSLVILHIADRPSAFEEAHIPGARFLRYGDFAVEGDKGLVSELPGIDEARRVFEAVGVSNGSRIVIYGSSPVMAARAFFTLDAMGHQRVALLDGGLRAWRAEGRAIETGPARAATPGRFVPALNVAKVASAEFIQQQMPANRIALVDVRPDPEFLGTDGGMGGMHAAGHIAGARQLTWNALVQEDGRFLSREQLQAKLDATGAAKDKPVVAYCMVGMRASVVYFVARHLGYDAKLYDGSIVDWTQKKLPVVTGRQ
jgi:thiosulfate/3-mercaptopyruvate sulfurtransferase